jgi:3-hydroxyacyl-CoA dehydrogenase/enoyl-CoA hydratase/3-hydroxybutyryl-CoA epimerase
MMLVELIMGKQTSDVALATAIDYVRKIRKTPIVVNDRRGFYTSRCFVRYVDEGLQMLAERITPTLIENAGRMAGMPMGPMEVLDSVGIDTSLKITRAYRNEVAGPDSPPSETEKVMAWIVEEQGRPGIKAGKGFYEYGADSKRTRLWPELFKYGGGEWRAPAEPDEVNELKLRFLTIQALEAARAVEEGVVTDPRDADVGAILGWGYAPYTGGPLSYIDTVGAAEFVRRCERMAKAYGERYAPNALLRDMAAKGETFYKRFAPKQAA